MKKICLFWDFDETLAYRDGMWTQSVCNILERTGYKGFDRTAISQAMRPHYPWAKHELGHAEYFNGLSWWGYIEQQVVGAALDAVGIVDTGECRRISGQFKDEYLKPEAWRLYEDTERNLARSVEAGYGNIILSNHTPELFMLAERLEIAKYFKGIVSSAEVGYEKPNPAFYKVIDSFAGYDEYYMIGNSYTADILGAVDYGIAAILVRSENTHNYPHYSKTLDGIWEFIK